jgi:ribonuclease BN (tRNA processing enzyme)
VLLDLGPGALERLWSRGMLADPAAIVISHMHMDHALDLLPLSGEVTQAALRELHPDRRTTPLYVPRDGGLAALKALASAVGSRFDRFPAAFDLREYDENDVVEVEELTLSFARTAHPAPCYAARISHGRCSIVYGADGAYSDSLVAHAAGADLALLEATYVEPGPEAERYGHMTGEQAGTLAERAGVRRLLLTHVGPWEKCNAENVRRARARFAGEVELVHEGGIYPVNTPAGR